MIPRGPGSHSVAMWGSVFERLVGGPERPGSAGDVDDARMFGRTQQRKERMRHPDRAEHVDGRPLHRCVGGQLLGAERRFRCAR
jgi:hypothetical protein